MKKINEHIRLAFIREIIVGLSLAWQEFLDLKKLAQTVFVSTEIYLPLLRYGFAKAVVFLLESE